MVKALAVRQTWASLIIVVLRGVNNRAWATSYRGRLATYAGGDLDSEGLGRYGQLLEGLRQLLRRAVLGTVVPADIMTNSPSPWVISRQCHWLLRYPALLSEPVRMPGQLGLLEWERRREEVSGAVARGPSISSKLIETAGISAENDVPPCRVRRGNEVLPSPRGELGMWISENEIGMNVDRELRRSDLYATPEQPMAELEGLVVGQPGLQLDLSAELPPGVLGQTDLPPGHPSVISVNRNPRSTPQPPSHRRNRARL